MNFSTILTIARERANKLLRRTPKSRGGRPVGSTKVDVELVAQLRADGYSLREIAWKVNVPKSTVADALRNYPLPEPTRTPELLSPSHDQVTVEPMAPHVSTVGDAERVELQPPPAMMRSLAGLSAPKVPTPEVLIVESAPENPSPEPTVETVSPEPTITITRADFDLAVASGVRHALAIQDAAVKSATETVHLVTEPVPEHEQPIDWNEERRTDLPVRTTERIRYLLRFESRAQTAARIDNDRARFLHERAGHPMSRTQDAIIHDRPVSGKIQWVKR